MLWVDQEYCFEVPLQAAGKRLDRFLVRRLHLLSRSQVQRLIEGRHVLVNSVPKRSSYKVQPGDIIEMQIPPSSQEIVLVPEEIPLEIIYEDEDLMVINKPQGMVVHPAKGHKKGTLVNALLNYCSHLSSDGGSLRPGIVHRLDKDTSGLLLVSKNDFTYHELARQLKARKIKRRYLALVHGEVREERGMIDAPLGRDPKERKKRVVLAKGTVGAREARTHYRVKERYCGYTLLEVSLETGRTHQIRVHLSYAGYPIAGDRVYCYRGNPLNLPGQALHAYQITFRHPRTSKILTCEAPSPTVFADVLSKIRCQGQQI